MAAQGNSAEAQYYLGETLLLRAYDYDNAIAWWRKAADQGHAGAQSNLGYMLTSGLGVEQNNDEAIRLFRLAAGKGHVEAQYNLGAMYDLGMSVRQDHGEAAAWFARAAENGLESAKAICCNHGMPVYVVGVPAVFGWLALDRRGRWRVQGATIRHAGSVAFINRNYAKQLFAHHASKHGSGARSMRVVVR